LPSTFDYAEGATFLAAHGTAYHALIDRGQLQPDEVLLVHGGRRRRWPCRGRDGQDARRDRDRGGSSEDKLAVAQKRGAIICALRTRTVRDAVKRITDGRGADVVFDPSRRVSRTACAASLGARVSWWSVSPAALARPHQSLADQAASVLGVRAGEAVRRDPASGEKRV